MLTNNKSLKGMVIRALDGEIGTVDDLYFDDELWTIRYLTVQTGSWLNDRSVLISPLSIVKPDWETKRLDVTLTRKQVENSPNIDTQMPLSRQHESEYSDYYRYPYYWIGPYEPAALPATDVIEPSPPVSGDSHLRSTYAVAGYHVDAEDGEIGHVDRFIIDDESWTIRYLEVATKNWWPGKKVLMSPAWVERVSWRESKVFVAVTREALMTCPEYAASVPITRDYESKIYFHYGRPPYWISEEQNTAAAAVALSLATPRD